VRHDEKAERPSGERVVESESDKDARIAAGFFAKEVDLQPSR
jgi:hypothetical protein